MQDENAKNQTTFGFMWKCIFITLFALIQLPVLAADTLKTRKKYFFGGFGAMAYKGSLATSYARWTPAITVGIRFEKKKNVNGMLALTIGKIIGEDRSYVAPANTPEGVLPVNRFETHFFSLHYEAQIVLFRYRSFRFFTSPGIGFLRYTPKDWSGNALIDRTKTRKSSESYSQNAFVFPIHIGIRYTFANEVALGFEAGWMNTRTKYLDNMDALSTRSGSDNIANLRFQFFLPIK